MQGAAAPSRRTATSQDVAALAGVSRPTVSQVLNGKAGLFAPETVARVLDAARELDYRPSVAGRALAKGRSDIVVVALPHVTFGVQLQDAIDALSARLADAGFAVVVHFTGKSTTGTDRLLDQLIPVAVADLGALDVRQKEAVQAQGTLVLTLGGTSANEAAGELQAQYLADHHRTRLDYALLDDPRRDPYGPEHLAGFARVCAHRGLPAPRAVRIPLDRRTARTALQDHLVGGRPDAFGCYNDEVAATLAAAAADLGLSVPGDLALIGIDDALVGRLSQPAITTLAPDMRAAGDAIADRFFAMIERQRDGEPVAQPAEVEAVFQVVERGSV